MKDDTSWSAGPYSLARRVERLKPSTIREILKTTEAPDVISFAGGLPAPDLFPVNEITRISAEVLAEDGSAALQYGITEGHGPLREWLCGHLCRTLDLRCTPEQILITHGSQQGLDLLAKVLLDPGDVVLVEDPAYVGALQTFGVYEADLVAVPIDDQGLRPDALLEALRSAPRRPRLLYTVPNFQNPTGVSTSSPRREQIARLAGDFGVPVVEDDPYGALRFRGIPMSALAGIAHPSGGVYLGTVSKVMAPGLRVGWMVVPDRTLYGKLVAAKQAADLHTSSLTQRIVTRFAESGRLEAHVTDLIPAYRRRRDTMLDALARDLPEGCNWTTPDGGFFVWVRLPEPLDTRALFAEAMSRSVAFVPGDAFWVGRAVRNTLRLSFSNTTEACIDEGVQRLGAAIRTLLDVSDLCEPRSLITR